MRKQYSYSFKYFPVVNNFISTSDIILRLSPERMIALTDEQNSYIEEANIASKMAIKGNYVALISGRADTTEEIVRMWKETPQVTFNEELKNLTKSFNEIYKRKHKDMILSVHGLEEDEYKTGKLKNGKEVSTDLLRRLQNETEEFVKRGPPTTPRFESYILYGGYNGKRQDMEIYEIEGAGDYNLQPNRFGIIGSGIVRAGSEINDFLESLPPEKRDDIAFAGGLHVSFRALVKSEKAPGVGGIPSVAVVERDSVRKLDSKLSRVMRNVVVKELKGEIGSDKAKTYLENLATGKTDTRTVIGEIFKPEDLEKNNLLY